MCLSWNLIYLIGDKPLPYYSVQIKLINSILYRTAGVDTLRWKKKTLGWTRVMILSFQNQLDKRMLWFYRPFFMAGQDNATNNHWAPRIVMMTTLSSLEVVISTIPCGSSGDKIGTITTLGLQWSHWVDMTVSHTQWDKQGNTKNRTIIQWGKSSRGPQRNENSSIPWKRGPFYYKYFK